MNSLAIIGGTFDPIHLGHIALIQNTQAMFTNCRITITYQPHLKYQAATYHHRLTMCQKVLQEEFDNEVGIMPTDRNSSFMVDNLHFFHKHVPDHHFYLILGSDCLNQIQSWHQWQSLVELCSLVVFERNGYPTKIPKIWQSHAQTSIQPNNKDKVIVLKPQIEIPQISSSECRLYLKKRINSQSYDGLPTYIRSYIDQFDLYQ